MVKSEPKKKPQSGGFFQRFFRKSEKSQKEQRLTVQRSIPYLEMGRDGICRVEEHLYGVMSNVRFDELELMLMAMFEQPTLKDTIQVLLEVQPLVAEDAEMAALVQQTIPKMQRLTEPQFKGLELEWHRPEDDAGK